MVDSEVLEVRPSTSRPKQGLVKVRTNTLNQDGEVVQTSVGNLVVPRRPASEPSDAPPAGLPTSHPSSW